MYCQLGELIMWSIFESEEEYKKALKESETVDGSSYLLSQLSIPLDPKNVERFFEEWPQYKDFPFYRELAFNENGKQSDAIFALGEYTIKVDRTAFLF